MHLGFATTTTTPPRKHQLTVEQFMFANPGWQDAATVKAGTDYAWSTVTNALEYGVMQRKFMRDGAAHTKGGIRYAAIVPYYGGYRLLT